MEKVIAPKFLEPWRIIIALTSEVDYEMDRHILAYAGEEWERKYMVIDGYHCSCYGFEEASWDAVVYSEEELTKLAKARIADRSLYCSCEREFWKQVADKLCLDLGD